VDLEQNPSADKLAGIFRTIHTIKGTSGFLGYGKLESITHVGENLLSRLRDGDLALDAAITSGLLALVDGVRRILAAIEADGTEGGADVARCLKGDRGERTQGQLTRLAGVSVADGE